MKTCELYLLTPPSVDPFLFKEKLSRALDTGPIAAVQLRLKQATDDDIARAIEVLQPIVQSRNIAFILNDRPDLAKKYGCDGAHIGMDDMDINTARAILGNDLQLGVSCYDSKDLAMKAGEQGADYIAFGAFFPSVSKHTEVRAPVELLKWWTELMELPVVAIGGINAQNCIPLVKAGADFISVINAVWNHPDGVEVGVKSLLKSIQHALEHTEV
ncbi:Thiamine-phosphate synthase [Commensalibacter sp. Nvir]|uniref:thiamine phosphate synthase n=1 Tax=Commensalibacter sp. Nvir TaxID=3069817 RepID=UPI002D34976E|nr:Thiamine-phosphate synthase [Commensalibacter sp. Nvir]